MVSKTNNPSSQAHTTGLGRLSTFFIYSIYYAFKTLGCCGMLGDIQRHIFKNCPGLQNMETAVTADFTLALPSQQ